MRGRTASLSYIVGFIVFAVAVATCSDLTAPAGLKGAVTIAYAGPPEAIGGAIRVSVGQKLSPTFQVSLSGIKQTRARYVLSLAKPEDVTVLRIFGSGSDSVEALGHGSATLVATLVVATVGPDTAHRASIKVIASAPPTIARVTPAEAVQGQTNVAVSVTGRNFVSGTTVDFGANITVSELAVVNATTLTATLAVAAGATTGLRDVIVINGATGGRAATLTNGFTVSAPAAPTMSLLSPAAGRLKAKITVAINGSNFYSGVTRFDFGDKIDVNSVSVVSSTQASVSISIGKPAAQGPRNVTVTNTPAGGSQTQQRAFTVLP